jgi:hypothetical protein
MLAKLVEQGKIKQQNLSSQDLALAGPRLGQGDRGGGGGGFFGKIIGGFQNLGSDIGDAAKSMPAGLVNSAKASFKDFAMNPIPGGALVEDLMGGRKSFLKEEVVDPTIDTYKYTYLGKGAPPDSSLLGRIYQHPLGPILDVASVLSLGAGAAAKGVSVASKSGLAAAQPGSRLHNAFLSTARSSVPTGKLPVSRAEGESVPMLEREYSTRPLRRALQYGTDRSTSLPFIGSRIEGLQSKITAASKQREDYSRKELQGNVVATREAIDPIVPLLNQLTKDEVAAIPLIGMRYNTPELIAGFQGVVRDAIDAKEVPSAITPELPESRANLSEDTVKYATDPSTRSEALNNFLSSYTERLGNRMYDDIGEEKLTEYLDMPRQSLLEKMGKEHLDEPDNDGAFSDGFLVPTQADNNVRYNRPNRFQRMLGVEEGLTLGRNHTFNAQNIGYQDIFRTPYMAGRPDPDSVLLGITRPDRRQFVDFLSKHERDRIERDFNEQLVHQYALKDSEGNAIMVDGKMTPQQVQAIYGPDFVPINPDIPWQFYSKEFTVAQALGKMEAQGFDMAEMTARMGSEAQDAALDITLAAQRTPNVVVPKNIAEYQLKLAGAHRPYENKFGRGVARAMNVWRTHTLTYMPRWALNTAVGSFALAAVKGISPRQYNVARLLRKTDVDATTGSLTTKLMDQPEMAGVNLASIASWDMMEMGAMGHQSALNIKTGVITRPIMRRVQQIEDHFRRASFVQSLDKRARAAMNQQGTIIRNLESSKGPRSTQEYVDFILSNPKLVQGAIEDLNKFSYNFATLGPIERRYVRQIVPFWGWYKFISMLAYRLPVDYPMRTNVMANIGFLGAAQTQETLGDMPTWLKGALPLSDDPKHFSYLSTMGLNPFSSFFNPMGEEGPVAGSLQMSQGSPLIQSLLSAYGVDTMRGGETPISPQTLSDVHAGRDFFGSLVKTTTGQELNPSQVAGGRRGLATLIRSFPMARIIERQQAGGRSSFPESLPWDPRPMATKPESRFGGIGSEVLQQMVGVAPRPYDLKGWQSLAPKRAEHAATRTKTDLKKLKKNLKGR